MNKILKYISLSLFCFLVGFFIAKVYFPSISVVEKNYNISGSKDQECELKLFEKEEKINSLNNIYSSQKEIYKLIKLNSDLYYKIGRVSDLSNEISEMFSIMLKIQSFQDIEKKYRVLYTNSHTMPLKSDIINRLYDTRTKQYSYFSRFFVFLNKKNPKNAQVSYLIDWLNSSRNDLPDLSLMRNEINDDLYLQTDLLLKLFSFHFDVNKKLEDILKILS